MISNQSSREQQQDKCCCRTLYYNFGFGKQSEHTMPLPLFTILLFHMEFEVLVLPRTTSTHDMSGEITVDEILDQDVSRTDDVITEADVTERSLPAC
jgi:hypothetical protein